MGEAEAAFRSLITRSSGKSSKKIAEPIPEPATVAAPADYDEDEEDASLQWNALAVPLVAGLAACIIGWLLLAS